MLLLERHGLQCIDCSLNVLGAAGRLCIFRQLPGRTHFFHDGGGNIIVTFGKLLQDALEQGNTFFA